jgi:predicted nucleic acid-binding protein
VIILDTNVVSELMRPLPADAVRTWVRRNRGTPIYTTAITLAEVRYGIQRLPAGRRRRALEENAERFFADLGDFILPFDSSAAMHYPAVIIDRASAGLAADRLDAQIAAICRSNDAPLATRNTKDFRRCGIELIEPWKRD